MPWKLGEDGNPVIDADSHRPIWIHPRTKAEAPFDPDEMHGKVVSVGDEAKTHREAAEALKAQLAVYSELGDDPKALADALAELKKLKAAAKSKGKSKGDGEGGEEVAALQEQIHELQEKIESAEKASKPVKAELEALRAANRQLTVGARFKADRHFASWTDDKGQKREPVTLLTPAVAEAYFGKHFAPDGNGGIVGYFKPGEDSPQKIHSQEDPSKPASFSECIERLLEKMPDKNDILRPLKAKGANVPGGGGPKGVLSTEDRSKLSSVERMKRARATG